MRKTVIALCLAATPAAADDYPFHGTFTYQDVTAEPAIGPLNCAFNFFTQDSAGHGHDYVLDVKLYLAKGQVSYLPIDTFSCSFNSVTQLEHCNFSERSDPQAPDQTNDKLLSVTPDVVKFAYFADLAAMARAVGSTAGLPDGASPAAYLRCVAFDHVDLARFLAADDHGISPEDASQALSDPFAGKPVAVKIAIARQILAKLTP